MNIAKFIPGLVLLAVGFGGGFAYNKYYQSERMASESKVSVNSDVSTGSDTSEVTNQDQSETKQPEPKNDSSKVTATTPKETNMDISNWTNYTDKSNGLTFKYPNGWKIKDNSGITNNVKYSTKLLISPDSTEDSPNIKMTFLYNQSKPANSSNVYYQQKDGTILKIELLNGDPGTNQAIFETVSY